MKFSRIAFIAASSLFLASCSSTKPELVYFTDIDSSVPAELGDYSVKIEPGDELMITVFSENPQASAIYNLPLINPAVKDQLTATTTPRAQTYIVDTKGNINFPILGEIHVSGQTVEQVRSELTKLISADVEKPVVSVDMVGYYVNVAGEVRTPGRRYVNTPRYSVLDAITAAGDLTQYAQRNNVLLIREENGKLVHTRLDLTSADFLSSPYYYVKQNDYIYVEPNKVRQDNAEYNQYNSYKLQVASVVVSSIVSAVSLIVALVSR